jgi:acetate kinase
MKAILTLNAGSSSIKFSVFSIQNLPQESLTQIYAGQVSNITKNPEFKLKSYSSTSFHPHLEMHNNISHLTCPYEKTIHSILYWLKEQGVELLGAGHRVVHGAMTYRQPMIIHEESMTLFEKLIPLAPLHLPYNLKGIRILQKELPNIPQIACFDTSFHTTCNEFSQMFALPKHLAAEGIRRYGFHGLSYEYVVSQLDRYMSKEMADQKIIIAHLGGGSTMCAVEHRKSVATTIGFSALDGLPMSTRCGTIDAGVLLYLMKYHHMDREALTQLLYKESGLLGVSGGVSGDMKELLAARTQFPEAQKAIDLYVYRISTWIGTLAAELQGLSGLVFTGGIGENAAEIRQKICERAAWLGVKIDDEKNLSHESSLHTLESRVGVYIIPTNEEEMIAKHTQRLLFGNN